MRLFIVLFALLGVAAHSPACGSPTPGSGKDIVCPWEAACQGLDCGDACKGRVCGDDCVIDPPCLASGCLMPSLLGHCDSSGQCVASPSPVSCRCEPACAGKACGDDCDPCGGLCMHPYASACDFAGRCVPKGPFICYDPCAGKACGATCHACPPDAPDCAETAVVKACDRDGFCQPLTPALTCP